MRTYQCNCGNILFFENSLCLACGSPLGYCPRCRSLVSLLLNGDVETCGNPGCGAPLQRCDNYVQHDVCNRCLLAEAEVAAGALCDCCRLNETIPDLSVPGHKQKWYRLEAAKRRLLYNLDLLRLPYGTRQDGIEPPLAFDFKADTIVKGSFWRRMGRTERVYTGHLNGRITINIREADDVEREKLRVDLGEAHRTLIGHFRHEIGHYYWQVLVQGRCEAECQAVFGDPWQPSYAEALDRYYRDGPPAGWRTNYVSAYATMHPWEDFAETFAMYLDVVATLDTTANLGVLPEGQPVDLNDFDRSLRQFKRVGVVVNELNRTMGLIDLVPEVLMPPVVEKMRYIHELVRTPSPPTEAQGEQAVHSASEVIDSNSGIAL